MLGDIADVRELGENRLFFLTEEGVFEKGEVVAAIAYHMKFK